MCKNYCSRILHAVFWPSHRPRSSGIGHSAQLLFCLIHIIKNSSELWIILSDWCAIHVKLYFIIYKTKHYYFFSSSRLSGLTWSYFWYTAWYRWCLVLLSFHSFPLIQAMACLNTEKNLNRVMKTHFSKYFIYYYNIIFFFSNKYTTSMYWIIHEGLSANIVTHPLIYFYRFGSSTSGNVW